jgi:hypothetical protein
MAKHLKPENVMLTQYITGHYSGISSPLHAAKTMALTNTMPEEHR